MQKLKLKFMFLILNVTNILVTTLHFNR